MSLCSKNCFKINFVDLCIYIPGDKATGKQDFQLFEHLFDGCQMQFQPSKGGVDQLWQA